MKLSRLLCLGGVVGLLAAVPGRAAGSAGDSAYVAKVFGLTPLHRIEIAVPEAALEHFRDRNAARLHATISFDGTVLKDVGVRQQGGTCRAPDLRGVPPGRPTRSADGLCPGEDQRLRPGHLPAARAQQPAVPGA